MIVFDTTIIIDILRGVDAARRFYLQLDDVPMCSEVTRVEVLSGMRSPERSTTRRLLDALDWAPVDGPIASRAGAFGRQHRASHQGLGLADLVIAATAAVNEAKLVTLNARHFPMLDRVVVPYSSSAGPIRP